MALSDTALASSVDYHRNSTMRLLEVRDLEVAIRIRTGLCRSVLDKINFHIDSGEMVGLLGESGSGKTTLALTILRLLPPGFELVAGSVSFCGDHLQPLRQHELRKIRGAKLSMIHQDSTVLNPVIRVGDQVIEVLKAHHNWNKQHYQEEARSLLEQVELKDVDRIYASYPHQLSGGQRQRIVIAQALACRPGLVIADEPTASLDQATAASILELMERLRRQLKTAFLIISHDIKTLARLSDRLMVMYAGRIVEQGPTQEVLRGPLHPYTNALLNCALPEEMPATAQKTPFSTIVGAIGGQFQTSHCQFEDRCIERMQICSVSAPRDFEVANARKVSCFMFGRS